MQQFSAKEKFQVDIAENHFQNHYQSQRNVITRTLFFFHGFDQIRSINLELAENNEQETGQNRQFEGKSIPNIKFNDSSHYTGSLFSAQLEQNQDQNNQIDKLAVFKSIVHSNSRVLIKSIVFFFFEIVFRAGVSLMLFYLFDAVSNGEKELGVTLAIFASLAIVFGNISRVNGFYQSSKLSERLASAIIVKVYQKISTLSPSTVKRLDMGKVINMISNDLNKCQREVSCLLVAIVAPIGFLIYIVIIYFRFGPLCLACCVIMPLITPLQLLLGQIASSLIKEVNIPKDQRVKLTQQMVAEMKTIKIYGWQQAFERTIGKIRSKQIRNMMKYYFVKSLQRVLAVASPLWAGLACILLLYYTDQSTLTVAKIFSILEIMNYIKTLIDKMGRGISFAFQILVVFERFTQIYNVHDINMVQITPTTKDLLISSSQTIEGSRTHIEISKDNSEVNIQVNTNPQKIHKKPSLTQQIAQEKVSKGEIKIQNFNGYWDDSDFAKPFFRNLNLHFQKGGLYGIGGKVRSGKTGLLSVMLQQIPYYEGSMLIRGSKSYVQQQIVLFSGSVKDNIIFGRVFNQDRYEKAIRFSCLEHDLQTFEKRDSTQIGGNGVSLSGGQRTRIALARALYQDADIYIFDDPFSALDSKVGSFILKEAIKGYLKGKTVILTTHHVNILQECDKVLILQNGEVEYFDKPVSIKQQLKELEAAQEVQVVEEQTSIQQCESQNCCQADQSTSKAKPQTQKFDYPVLELKEQTTTCQLKSSVSDRPKTPQLQVQSTYQSYLRYFFFRRINFILVPITILLFTVTQAINTAYFRLIANFDNETANNLQGKNFQSMDQFWTVLGLLQLGYVIFLFLKYICLFFLMMITNKKIHRKMVEGVCRSEAAYFDKNAPGELISIFSNDIGLMDLMMGVSFLEAFEGLFIITVLMVNIFQINVYYIVAGVLTIIFAIFYYRFCIPSIIKVMGLYLKLKSPIFKRLNQMVSGLTLIHIYGQKQRTLKQFCMTVNQSLKACYSQRVANRTFGLHVSLFSNILFTVGLAVGVVITDSHDSGLYAIAALFLVQINDQTQLIFRRLIYLEGMILSSERALNVCNLKPQAELYTDYDRQSGFPQDNEENTRNNHGRKVMPTNNQWPLGQITVEDMILSYGPESPDVLKGVRLQINPSEKVGIVGRTGAGKSSILTALLRLYEPKIGTVYTIDGKDATKMGLHTLRKNIGVIPQTPFLFEGTIRQNLDPYENYPMEDIWKALQQTEMKSFIESLPEKLQTKLSNLSSLLSMGQKQLFCLVRVLLKKPRILFLDEATSSVDQHTDDLIQSIIRKNFADATILTIAHRLNTIASYDKVAVIAEGIVAQIGNPHQLIERKGRFHDMVRSVGRNSQKIIQIAKESFENKQKLKGEHLPEIQAQS